MKIAQGVGWYLPESLGGTEVYVRALSRRLQSAGHEVKIACPEPGGTKIRTYDWENVEVFRYPTPVNPTRAECQSIERTRGTEAFFGWLKEFKADVFHCHTFVTGLGIFELEDAKRLGCRVIATTHSSGLGYTCARGTLMEYGERLCDGIVQAARCSACELQHRGLPLPLASIVSKLPVSVSRIAGTIPGKLGTMLGMPAVIARNQELQKRVNDTVDQFVVLTEYARKILIENGGASKKITVNRLGVDLTEPVTKQSPREKPTNTPVRIGYLGRYDRIKGVFVLAKAIAALPKNLPLSFEYTGPLKSDADREVLNHLKAIVGEDPRVSFGGAIPPSEVPARLRSWDVACFPAICLEGGPTAALEAQSVGVPVVGARIGGLAEFVEDGVNGRLLPPGDSKALANVFLEIARNPQGTVDEWRKRMPAVRKMDEVTADYLTMYQGVREIVEGTANGV